MDDSGHSPFKISAASDAPSGSGEDVTDTTTKGEPIERMGALVNSADIFLLIKGTPQRPQCGFSANTVAIMDSLRVPYRTLDVLSDEEIRSAAKDFAGWPTFPQVYVRGEFVGGNDIISEMHAAGELQDLVRGNAS